MKILILNWRDLKNPRAGGAELVTEEVAKRLVKKGFKITLFCSSFPGSKKQETVSGYEIIRKGSEKTVHLWAFVFWLKKFRKENFKLVIDQIHGLPFFTPLYLRKVKKIAFIHEVAQKIWLKMYPSPLNWLGYLAEPLFYKFYKKIPLITVSNSTQQDLVKIGIPEQNIFIIPEATTVKPLIVLPPKEPVPTIIFVGRICPMKRVDELLKAYLIAKKQISNLKLWLVGSWDKKYQQKLNSLITSH